MNILGVDLSHNWTVNLFKYFEEINTVQEYETHSMKTFFECHIGSCFCVFEIIIDHLLFGESSTILDIMIHKIAELDFPNLIIDMNRVKIIDSSGIGLLMSIKRLINAHKKELVIANNDIQITKLLNITGLENYFQVFNKLDDATSYFLNNEKANI